MLDVFEYPRTPGRYLQYFCLPGFVQIWNKPRGASMVFIMALSSGGGGGGGLSRASGAAGGGGGAGGAGAVTSLIIPAMLIPDRLYITVGAGGAGGSGTGVAGSGGAQTTVAFSGNAGASNNLLTAANVQAGGGTAGTAAGSNAGGAGATPYTNANSSQWAQGVGGVMQWFTDTSTTSASGAITGANGGIGTGPNIWASSRLTRGCGGGTVGTNNTDFAGGSIGTAGSPDPLIQINGGSGGAPGGHGSDGYCIIEPYLILTGGAGGGTSGASGGVGGKGGVGGYGCGGGGGGAGTSTGGGAGGAGGRGGHGLVIISAW